jgi:methionyl-tRNA formyltransferase
MRVAIVGQQAFGKSVLDAFIGRGDEVAGVFVFPEAPGARPDPLRLAAEQRKLPVFQFHNYGAPEALAALKSIKAEIGILAYVTQFVPQSFVTLPKHGMILFHPSLLPLHRGPAAINWAVILGEQKTGLTILRPTDGLDEGAVILQREVEIGPDDTVGGLYFDKIVPMGVSALIEAAELAVTGRAKEKAQDENHATYEGWVRLAESRIDWAGHVDRIYDLIRGCDPSPGAWTSFNDRRLFLFDARKRLARNFAAVKGLKPGEVVKTAPESFTVHAQGGFIEVRRCRVDEGKKISAGEAGIAEGTLLG